MLDKTQRRTLKRKYKLFRKFSADNFNHFLFYFKPNRLVNNKEIRFVGMQRSGNHAVLNWLFYQLKEVRCFLNYAEVDKNPFIYFHKQGTVTEFPQDDFYEKFNIRFEQWGFFSKKDTLIYSYEDEFIDQVFSKTFEMNHDRWVGRSEKLYDILLIRDPFNLFASRLKQEEAFVDKYSLHDDKGREILINIWKQHAKEFLNQTDYLKNNKIVVNYNQWFMDKGYRKSLADRIGVEFDDKTMDEVLPVGGGSSFDNGTKKQPASEMKVLERWQFYKDMPLYRNIFKDKEIIELSDAIFGEIPGVKEWLNESWK